MRRFGFLKQAIGIDINLLSQVIIMTCFVLQSYCEIKKEKVPGKKHTLIIESQKEGATIYEVIELQRCL